MPVQTIANVALRREGRKERALCENAARSGADPAGVEFSRGALSRLRRRHSRHLLLPQHPRGEKFTSLHTPVIEMGVSNGVAVLRRRSVRADSRLPYSPLSFTLSLAFTLSPRWPSAGLPFPRPCGKKKKKKREKRSGEARLGLDRTKTKSIRAGK